MMIILLFGLRVQLQRLGQWQNVNPVKEIREGIIHVYVTVTNWFTLMQDYDEVVPKKPIVEAQVIPYQNKAAAQPERREDNRNPWELVKKMMVEQQQATITIKWTLLPMEMLMDEQFLAVLHAIEEVTDIAPLREASQQLPQEIYEIIRTHDQLTRVSAELTDQLVFDVSKKYYYSVIESLSKLVRSIQQGQGMTLISLA